MSELTPQTHLDVSTTITLSQVSWTECEEFNGAAISIKDTGNLTLSQAELTDNITTGFGGAIYNRNILTLNGDVIFSGNKAAVSGGAIYTGKNLTIDGAEFYNNSATQNGGAIDLRVNGILNNVDFKENTASNIGGAVYLSNATATFNQAIFLNNSAKETGGAIYNSNNCNLTIKNSSFLGNTAKIGGAILNDEKGTISLTNVAFLSATDSIKNYGTMTFHCTITLSGTLSTESKITATGVSLVLDISRHAKAGNAAIVENLAKLSGVKDYSLNVSESQAAGTYSLMDNAGSFDDDIVLACDDFETVKLALDESHTYHNSVYEFTLSGNDLEVNVKDYNTTASPDNLTWDDINGAKEYQLSLSDGEDSITLNTDEQGIDLLGLDNGEYKWEVRSSSESDNWQKGQDFNQTSQKTTPQHYTAATNLNTDLFFARISDIWSEKYSAKHVGNIDGWKGTGQTISLAGKAQIADIFTGSEDASILLLDAFDNNFTGMALFIDDLYSAAPDSADQARLSQIDTIICSNNGDLIDLTSQSFEFKGGVTVKGGDGHDIIWANSENNTLIGGAGNDQIIGGGDDDLIIGGIGNDTLHGGGGDDTFYFDTNWGQDTVTQLNGGSVVLWFSENKGTWNKDTMTYTCGDNSVTVSGIDLDDIQLKFGGSPDLNIAIL